MTQSHFLIQFPYPNFTSEPDMWNDIQDCSTMKLNLRCFRVLTRLARPGSPRELDGVEGLGRQLHSQSVAPFVPRKHLPDRAFPGAVLPPRGRWMCCAGFPWSGVLSTLGKGGLGWRVHLGSQFCLFSPHKASVSPL